MIKCSRVAESLRPGILRAWEEIGQMKVVLQVPTGDLLTGLAETARAKGLPHYLLTRGAEGVLLAVGPCAKDQIDAVSGSLKLY